MRLPRRRRKTKAMRFRARAFGGGSANQTPLAKEARAAPAMAPGAASTYRKRGKGIWGAPAGCNRWGLYIEPPQLSAPSAAIRAAAPSYEQVDDFRRALRVALVEKGAVLRKSRECAPSKRRRRRRWFCAEDGAEPMRIRRTWPTDSPGATQKAPPDLCARRPAVRTKKWGPSRRDMTSSGLLALDAPREDAARWIWRKTIYVTLIPRGCAAFAHFPPPRPLVIATANGTRAPSFFACAWRARFPADGLFDIIWLITGMAFRTHKWKLNSQNVTARKYIGRTLF